MHLDLVPVLQLPLLGRGHARERAGDARAPVLLARRQLQPVDRLQQLGLLGGRRRKRRSFLALLVGKRGKLRKAKTSVVLTASRLMKVRTSCFVPAARSSKAGYRGLETLKEVRQTRWPSRPKLVAAVTSDGKNDQLESLVR